MSYWSARADQARTTNSRGRSKQVKKNAPQKSQKNDVVERAWTKQAHQMRVEG